MEVHERVIFRYCEARVTQFTISFLTPQSILDKMVMLGEKSKWSKTAKGKDSNGTILDPTYWTSIGFARRPFSPLVRVLHLATVIGDQLWASYLGACLS